MIRLLVSFFMINALAGCATTQGFTYPTFKQLPEVNSQSSVSVGSAVYRSEAGLSRFTLIDQLNGTSQKYVSSVGSSAQELLYSGVFQDQVKVTYREFSDDLARPAFFQEAQYELEGGVGRVNFRGAIIDILKADNQALTYIVRKGFDGEVAIQEAATACRSQIESMGEPTYLLSQNTRAVDSYWSNKSVCRVAV